MNPILLPAIYIAALLLVGGAVVALPNPINPRGQNLTNHYDLLGAAAISAGNTADAVAILRNAVRDDPESADHHYNLAVALGSLAQSDERVVREIAGRIAKVAHDLRPEHVVVGAHRSARCQTRGRSATRSPSWFGRRVERQWCRRVRRAAS